MNLYEYQSKKLLKQYGLPILNGQICSNLFDVQYCIKHIQNPWVIKCQIYSGGRGKSGGICITCNSKDMLSFSKKWFGQRLKTYQTTQSGELVNYILVEPAVKVIREFYVGISINRDTSQIICMASKQGGINIEDIGKNTPHLINKVIIDPLSGIYPYQGRILACNIGLSGIKIHQFSDIIVRIARLFLEKDLTLIEINPLVLDDKNNFICLDAKISIDDNAIFRQLSWIKTLYAEDINKNTNQNKLINNTTNYIALEQGNIGCMVNGAGLAMATMDLIKSLGGEPANFLDIGGDADKKFIISSLHTILKDTKIQIILINIFGGIVCCDLIAESIIATLSDYPKYNSIPIVVRLEGNNAKLGINRLINSGYKNITVINDLVNAIKKVISIIRH